MIDEYFLKLTYLEKQILQIVRKDLNDYIGLSINDISAKLFTTPATISKVIRKIGFDSYKDFQDKLLLLKSEKNKKIIKFDNLITRTEDALNVVIKNVSNYKEKEFDIISENILKSNSVVTIGFGYSSFAASELAKSLGSIGINTKYSNDIFGDLILFENMDGNNLVIIYSHLFSSKTITRLMEYLETVKTNIILITSEDQKEIITNDKIVEILTYKKDTNIDENYDKLLNQSTINHIIFYNVIKKMNKEIKTNSRWTF